MEANRKRNRVAFASDLNPYGYDPQLPVLSGDWRLNPGQLGKVWHPSQPVRNSWSDWASAERQIFDFSKRQYAPVDPHLTGEAAAAKLSYLNLDVAQADPGDVDLAEGVGGLSSSALATGDSDIGFDQAEHGLHDVVAQRSSSFIQQFFSAPPPVQSQFVDPVQSHASLVPSGAPTSALPQPGQARLAFYTALGVAHAFVSGSESKRGSASGSSGRLKRDGSRSSAVGASSPRRESASATTPGLASAYPNHSGNSSKASSRSNSRPCTPSSDSMLVDGAVDCAASVVVSSLHGSSTSRPRAGTGTGSEGGLSEGAVAAVEEGGGMIFVAEPDPEEAELEDDMGAPFLASANTAASASPLRRPPSKTNTHSSQEQEEEEEEDSSAESDSSEEDERPARRSRRDRDSDVGSSVRSRGSSAGSGTSRGSRSSRSSGGGGGGTGAQLDDLNRPSMLLHTNAYGRPSCCDQGFAAEFVAMKAQQQQQQQQQQTAAASQAGGPTAVLKGPAAASVAFSTVDEVMTVPRPPSRSAEIRKSALHTPSALPPGVIAPTTLSAPVPAKPSAGPHPDSFLPWLRGGALAASVSASASGPLLSSATGAFSLAATRHPASAATGGVAALALTKALTAPTAATAAAVPVASPASFPPTGSEAARQVANTMPAPVRVIASADSQVNGLATRAVLVPYTRPKQVGVSTGETDDEEEAEKPVSRSSALAALRGLGAANKRQASDPAVVALLQAVKVGGKAVLQKMTDEQRRLVKMERTKLNKRASRARERAHDKSLALITRMYELTTQVLAVARPGKLGTFVQGRAEDWVDEILSLPVALFPALAGMEGLPVDSRQHPQPKDGLMVQGVEGGKTLAAALGVKQNAALRGWLQRMVLGLSIPSACVPAPDSTLVHSLSSSTSSSSTQASAGGHGPQSDAHERVLAAVLQVAQARKDGAAVQHKLAPSDGAVGRSSSARRSGRGAGPVPNPIPSRPTRSSARVQQTVSQAQDMEEEPADGKAGAASRGSAAPGPAAVPGLPSKPGTFLEMSDLPSLPSSLPSSGGDNPNASALEALAANPLAAVHALTVQQGPYRDRFPLLAYRMALDRSILLPTAALPSQARPAAEQLGLGLRTTAAEVECLAVLQQVVRSDGPRLPSSSSASSLSSILRLTPAQRLQVEAALPKADLRAQAGVLKRGHAAGEYVSKTLFSIAQEEKKGVGGDSGTRAKVPEDAVDGGEEDHQHEEQGGDEGEESAPTTGSSASNAAIQGNAVLSELAAGTSRESVARLVEWVCSQPLARATGPGPLHPSSLPNAATMQDLRLRPEDVPAVVTGVADRHASVGLLTDLGGYAFVQQMGARASGRLSPGGAGGPVTQHVGVDIGRETDLLLFQQLSAALEAGQRQASVAAQLKPAAPPALASLMSSCLAPAPAASDVIPGTALGQSTYAAPAPSEMAVELPKRPAAQAGPSQSIPWGASLPVGSVPVLAMEYTPHAGVAQAGQGWHEKGAPVPGKSNMAAF